MHETPSPFLPNHPPAPACMTNRWLKGVEKQPRAYPGEEVCGKAVDGVIRQLDGFFIMFEFEQWHSRPKGLLPVNLQSMSTQQNQSLLTNMTRVWRGVGGKEGAEWQDKVPSLITCPADAYSLSLP